MPYEVNKNEQKIIDFWKQNNTFQKSVDKNPGFQDYIFYDGPPFATGLPHYGHILASTIKDVVARYWTMKGKRIERVWGWDCHGLPIENIVEKELGTKSKKDIEDMGVAKFNETCRSKVLGYVEDWEKTIERLGRWVDMKNAYRTMDRDYMESIWWVFKELWDKGLIYKDYKSMHICPRCETTLSQSEVTEGYKDVKDLTLTAKFKLKASQKINEHDIDDNTYILAWTTTPWTLPGNVLLAVGADVDYIIIKFENSYYILAKTLLENNLKDKEANFEIIKTLKGKDLVGLEYEPLFPYYKDTPKAFRVVAGDFVTTEDGTGIVHIAPAFGDDDLKLGRQEDIPLVQHVAGDGTFKPEVTDFVGLHVKPIEDIQATDVEIIKYLANNNKLFAKHKLEHSYPHCWRCDTPLLNYATDSWFVAVNKIKDRALANAEKINWSPEHIKDGRFGKWLENARDWSISRQRFWASVMPVWECVHCEGDKKYRVFGSVAELEELSGQKIDDLHKHIIDKVTIKCEHCQGEMKRIPDVLDTWFDSGSMPYAQVHYPFENKDKFDHNFPAQFIAEGVDQTRAWFYYLHIIATALKDDIAFENVIVNGIVVAEDGKKMSKKLKNYPDPNNLIDKYGADALRYYLINSPVVQSENLAFSESGVRDIYNKIINTLWNVLQMYEMFADGSEVASQASTNLLDQWILAKLDDLNYQVDKSMQAYKLNDATRPILDFVTELSQWYVRRSRTRLKSDNVADKAMVLATLRHVLVTVTQIIAPITPFVAEKVYQAVTHSSKSVHLEDWPEVKDLTSDQKQVLEQMDQARRLVEQVLSLRAASSIKTRQPLQTLEVVENLSEEMIEIIKEEVNVKEVVVNAKELKLDTNISDELKQEGIIRELTRQINALRKDTKLTINDQIDLAIITDDKLIQQAVAEYKSELLKATLAQEIVPELDAESVEISIDEAVVKIAIKKV